MFSEKERECIDSIKSIFSEGLCLLNEDGSLKQQSERQEQFKAIINRASLPFNNEIIKDTFLDILRENGFRKGTQENQKYLSSIIFQSFAESYVTNITMSKYYGHEGFFINEIKEVSKAIYKQLKGVISESLAIIKEEKEEAKKEKPKQPPSSMRPNLLSIRKMVRIDSNISII